MTDAEPSIVKKPLPKNLLKLKLSNVVKSYQTKLELAQEEQDKLIAKYRNWTGRVVTVADFHLPFVRVDLLEEVVEREAKAADLWIFNGDIFGLDDLSRWRNLRRATFHAELEQVRDIFAWLGKRLRRRGSDIIFLEANHEKRIEKHMWENLQAELADVVVTNCNAIKKLFEEIPTKIIHVPTHWCKIGDTIFTHPSSGSKVVRMRTAEYALKRFWQRDKTIRGLVCAHTHYGGECMVQGAKVIEQGCLCKVLDWSREKDMGNSREDKWYQGYAYVTMEKGRIDFNGSHWVYLDEETL